MRREFAHFEWINSYELSSLLALLLLLMPLLFCSHNFCVAGDQLWSLQINFSDGINGFSFSGSLCAQHNCSACKLTSVSVVFCLVFILFTTNGISSWVGCIAKHSSMSMGKFCTFDNGMSELGPFYDDRCPKMYSQTTSMIFACTFRTTA